MWRLSGELAVNCSTLVDLPRQTHVSGHCVVLLCEQRTTDAAVCSTLTAPSVAALFFTVRDSYG